MEKDPLDGRSGVLHDVSLLSELDIFLFKQGNHFHLYKKMGAHTMTVADSEGTLFVVWAPDAEFVSVFGDFNDWDKESRPLKLRQDGSGIWEGFVPGAHAGHRYKYFVKSRYDMYKADKGDPYAFWWEVSPQTASRIWALDYAWNDAAWITQRREKNALHAPLSVYEMHLGSWKRVVEEGNRFLTYRELAAQLPGYLKQLGFTHVEFLPVMEHPFYGSWGYQTAGYFAPSSRYGTPQDFMHLIDTLHQNGIGVILDWVPSHFPSDEHGIAYFDGTHLFEHADPRKGFHPDWSSYIFNYGRNEVRAFLVSSAMFWLDVYHIDALRIDAVASMLYLDYSRKEGEWIPNQYGGRENLDAIAFLRRLNETLYTEYPDTQTIAEESTAWPMVTRPPYIGGLGFGMKWNMGWMHDTLEYFSKDSIFRKYHHNELTFSLWYAFWENFVLALSHDEVVHGKRSLLGKMPGDDWQKFASLRLLYGYMFGHPGKKLLFMGAEIAQWQEWNHDASLQWHLLDYGPHQGVQKLIGDLNALYRTETALWELDFTQEGFEWIDAGDWEGSIISFIRKDRSGGMILVVCNFTPVVRHHYRVGAPRGGFWKEVLNTDAPEYGGSGQGNPPGVTAEQVACLGREYSLTLTIPPLAAVFLKHVSQVEEKI